MAFLPLLGVILTGLGLFSAAATQRAQQKFQADVAKANQKAAEMEGAYAQDLAAKKAAEHKQKVRRLVSTQRAKQASSGFVVGEGTFGDIIEDTEVIGELDTLAIRHEGDLAAWRAREKAKQFSAQSAIYTSAGKNIAGEIAAAGTLLTGLAEL